MSIREDIFCITCRYNVRGLDPHGRCPECGTSIANSMPFRTWRSTVYPFLPASLLISFMSALFYFAIICRFYLQWMAYNAIGGLVVVLALGTPAALIAWPLMRRSLPARTWWPYAMFIAMMMAAYGGLISISVMGRRDRQHFGLIDGVLFFCWPLMLFGSIGLCAIAAFCWSIAVHYGD